MYVLILDVPVTRRQRIHHVIGPHDELAFSSARLTQCLEFMIDRGARECVIKGDLVDFAVKFDKHLTKLAV